MAHVPMDRVILRKMAEVGIPPEKNSFYRIEQGNATWSGIISASVGKPCSRRSGAGVCGRSTRYVAQGLWQGILARVHLIRYADDFIITGKSKKKCWTVR